MGVMHMSIADSLLVTALGMGVVFFVLIILNLMIKGLSILAAYVDKHAIFRAVAGQGAIPLQPVRAGAVGPGVAVAYQGADSGVRLYDVDVKTAAMIMAVVAHQTSIPLNELRFISIRNI
ncbi:MAG: OadG family protein [Peptococcaceae bacterium]|jgi:hypothetical protein|nr:OadG family protein [Peptococcaceae bacterium]